MRPEGGIPVLLLVASTVVTLAGCSGLGALRDGDPNVDVRVIQRASLSSDSSLAAPLIAILGI